MSDKNIVAIAEAVQARANAVGETSFPDSTDRLAQFALEAVAILRKIKLEPEEFNEWGEALRFRLAQTDARALLSKWGVQT